MLIGEVDSGYYDAHSQLSASRYSGLTVGGIAGAYNPAHNDSHGTHVAGTLAAARDGGNAATNFHGVAFDANVVAGNTGKTDYWLLDVDGLAIFGGTLALSFLDGFTFGIGTYDLIGFGSRFGQFSDYAFHGLDGGFTANVLYTADGVEPSIAAIPEPETYALMLGGLALMGGWLGAASASDRPRGTEGSARDRAPLFHGIVGDPSERMTAWKPPTSSRCTTTCSTRRAAARWSRFEASGQAKRGQTGSGVDTSLKGSWDIRLDERPAWADAKQQLNEAVLVGLRRYRPTPTPNSMAANRCSEQCCGRST